jgi:hypothetical protein
VLRDALYLLSAKRGKEPDEMTAEMQGLADASKLPFQFVKGIQMLYEIQTMLPPIVNLSHIPEEWRALSKWPFRGPGCTGIIAQHANGSVYHARNLDFSPVKYMTNLVYTGIFTKGGKEIFRSQMIAGYQQMITGMRMGPDGYSIERNTRYPTGKGGNEEMLGNLLGGRQLNGWTLRKVLEEQPDFDSAIAALSAAPYVSTEYTIVSGVRKGAILSRDPDRVAYKQTLGQPNFEERDDYIIITNFDFFWHDVREFFDPTGGKIGHPRRVAAQKFLNATDSLTPELLFEAIDAPGVIADTVFQAIIGVETNHWNVSIPDL